MKDNSDNIGGALQGDRKQVIDILMVIHEQVENLQYGLESVEGVLSAGAWDSLHKVEEAVTDILDELGVDHV